MSHKEYTVSERPPLREWIPLSLQHVFAMFGATVLVPILTGLSPAVALFTSGIGTLLYILITKAKVPVYLGSSFAFIPPIIAISGAYGIEYALGASVFVGIFYVLVASIIARVGTGWLDKIMPPVVVGSIIIVIGLKLAPVALSMAMGTAGGGAYSLGALTVAGVTLGIAVIAMIVLKGFFTVIPVLCAIIGGYLFALVMGIVAPSVFTPIDFKSVAEAAWISTPKFAIPKFSLVPILTFLLVSLATIAEHLGDTLVAGRVVGKDFYKDPGIHRTLLGDGLATGLAAFFGGPPNTTYGENIGVLSITRVFSIWVVGGAAVIAIILSFLGKFGALISTIPTPVMGGVSTLLFGIIASAGLRTLVESGVDYSCKRNLTISSVIMVIGLGGGKIFFPITGSLNFMLEGLALATLIGILLNLVLPKNLDQNA